MKAIYSIFLVALFISYLYDASALKKKGNKEVQKVDLPYIACEVCEKVVEELYHETERLRKEAPYNKLEEIQVTDVMDGICKDDEKSGEWLRRLDINEEKVKDKKYLKLKSPGGVSKCEVECATLSKSCNNFIEDEIDRDLLSGMLWKGKVSLEEAKVMIQQII